MMGTEGGCQGLEAWRRLWERRAREAGISSYIYMKTGQNVGKTAAGCVSVTGHEAVMILTILFSCCPFHVHLPSTGWGSLLVWYSKPSVLKAWIHNGPAFFGCSCFPLIQGYTWKHQAVLQRNLWVLHLHSYNPISPWQAESIIPVQQSSVSSVAGKPSRPGSCPSFQFSGIIFVLPSGHSSLEYQDLWASRDQSCKDRKKILSGL